MPKYLIDPPHGSGWMQRYIDAPGYGAAREEIERLGYPDRTRIVVIGDPPREPEGFDVVTEQPCAHVHTEEGERPIDATEALLAERGKTHGRFEDHARFTMEVKRVIAVAEDIRAARGLMPLIDTEREALHMIAHKIGRILAGKSDFADHWDDIAGYARLVSRELSPQGRDAI